MGSITIVGLGPGDKKFLTFEAIEAMKSASTLLLRTEKHPVNEYLKTIGLRYETFDEYYQEAESFELVYERIAQKVMDLAVEGDVVYGVPGNPHVAERSVELLLERTEAKVVYGVSFLDAMLHTLQVDPVHGLQVVDGLKMTRLDPRLHQLVIQVYDRMTASSVKLALLDQYHDDHVVTIVKSAGITGQEELIRLPLYELDRGEYFDHLTSIYLPPLAEAERKKDFADLLALMTYLRSDQGCPWDRKQTHDSIKKDLLEEAYEVIEAIEADDPFALEEELGDLLLQVVFHSIMGQEAGYFTALDVTNTISEKLIRRHPHVFGDQVANSAEEVLRVWDEAKQEEKAESLGQEMSRLPKSMSPLLKAHKLQKMARKDGFDWSSYPPALEKVDEELEEVKAELAENNLSGALEELGDLLFAVVNLIRLLDGYPDDMLEVTNKKFVVRFLHMEEMAKKQGISLKDLPLEELENLWQDSKIKKT